MKRKNNYFIYLVSFLIGCIVSYILSQYEYLIIDEKVNVTSTLISLTTALIGLYIAISIKKTQTKSSNLHNYLQPKLDLVWNQFLSFSHIIILNDNIELVEVTKAAKEMSQNLTPLKKMFETFNLNDENILKLEQELENLESYLTNIEEINENIINYQIHKEQIKIKLDIIHSHFVLSLKEINDIT